MSVDTISKPAIINSNSYTQKYHMYTDLNNKYFVIHCKNIEITPQMLKSDMDMDIYIFGDQISLNGAFKHCGKNFYLSARRIDFGSSIIDVSGREAEIIQPLKAPINPGYKSDGSGNDGASGLPGNPGGNGGNIKIFANEITGKVSLIANGAQGGQGQEGGEGYQGKEGDSAAEIPTTTIIIPGKNDHRNVQGLRNKTSGNMGCKGKKGGMAGKGGEGGLGGNAGTIKVYIKNNSIDDIKNIIKPEAKAGIGGEPGQNGNPGPGGYGGPGSYNIDSYREERGDGAVIPVWTQGTRAAIGPQGDEGDKVPKNQNGDNGNSKYKVDGCDNVGDDTCYNYKDTYNCDPNLDLFVTRSQLNLILNEAKKFYINKKYQEVFDRLEFITNLPSDIPNLPIFTEYVPLNNSTFELVKKEAEILMNQLILGLDYFGHLKNYVTTVNKDKYGNEFKDFLEIYREIYKNYYFKYLNDFQNNDILKQNIIACINKANDKKTKIQKDVDSLNDKLNNLTKEFQDLDNLLSTLHKKVEDSKITFKTAVQKEIDNRTRKNQIETLFDKGKEIYSLINAGTDIYSGIDSISNFLKKVSKCEEYDLETIKILYKEYQQEQASDVSQMISGFDTFSHRDKLDKAKKITNDDLDSDIKELKQYAPIEADNYLRLLQDYVDTLNARNQKLLIRADYLNEIDKLKHEIILINFEVNENNKLLSQAESPNFIDNVMFFEYLIIEYQRWLLYLIYKECNAFKFCKFEEFPLNTESIDPESLGRIHSQIIKNNLEFLERNISPSQRSKAIFLINKDNYPELFTFLGNIYPEQNQKIQKPLEFLINLTPILARGMDKTQQLSQLYTEIRMEEISVTLNNANNGYLVFEFEHQGNSYFKNRLGKEFNFIHSKFPIIIDSDRYIDLKDKEHYEVSPFALWKIIFPIHIENKDLDLRAVNSMKVEITFNYYPKNLN